MNRETYDDIFESARLEFIAAHEAGESPTLEAFAARYPAHAADLTDFVLDYLRLESLESQPLPATISPETRRGIDRALATIGIMRAGDTAETPGETIVDARKALGLTAAALARALKLPASVVVQIERGQVSSWPDKLAKTVADALRITVDRAQNLLRQTARSGFSGAAVGFSASENPDIVRLNQGRQTKQDFDELLARAKLTPEQAEFWRGDSGDSGGSGDTL